MLAQADLAALSALARGLPGLDVDCYARHGRDPASPLLGLGRRDASLCFVGRDPGESEIAQWRPFVGPSGRKIRDLLPGGAEDDVFWINTVPYKPQGNKAWPLPVRRAFQAVLFPLLLREWDGRDVLTFGSEAFRWFALGQPEGVRVEAEAFWAREDKFSASLPLELAAGEQRRTLVLHPLPHPSPANAQWKQRFPQLLQARLEALLPRRA
jgi:uracil-DNA glycosylase